jgi:hypothetical protein
LPRRRSANSAKHARKPSMPSPCAIGRQDHKHLSTQKDLQTPCAIPLGRNVGWREPRGGADAAFRGCAPHWASVEQFLGRSWPHVACWVVIVHRSRSSCRERSRSGSWSSQYGAARAIIIPSGPRARYATESGLMGPTLDLARMI